MNYKTMLLASAAVLFSSQAMAADLTGALYVPGEGQLTSDTILSQSRVKGKHGMGAGDATTLAEVLEYGVTDQLTVLGSIANAFDVEGNLNNSHNFEYAVGAKYTTKLCDKTTFQVAVDYETWKPRTWYGHQAVKNTPLDRWQKNIGVDFKLGYDLGDGLSAYGIYGFDSDIDQADRTLGQSLKVGLHKYTGEWALDGAVRYDFSTDGKDYHSWWADVAADYYVKENVALGVYGSYFLDGSDRPNNLFNAHNIDYAYEGGIHVKVLF